MLSPSPGAWTTSTPSTSASSAPARASALEAHLDFWVDDLATSIAFVEQLGGTVLDQHSFEEWTIAVMADREGIESGPWHWSGAG